MTQQPPLRAVIIDNDETTGSYTILFAMIWALRQIPNIEMSRVATILQRLGTWMIRHHVFRPGLRMFLQTLLQLKSESKIDTVIMYTNQKDNKLPKSYTEKEGDFLPLLWSPPLCISYMFCYLMGNNVIDGILSRPDRFTRIANRVIVKQWSRILDQFPDRPKDIRSMMFIDDLACPAYISSGGIPKQNTDPSCWHRVEPYYRNLSESEIYDCLRFCFEDLKMAYELFDTVYAYYVLHVSARNSTPNATVFLKTCDALETKFGAVDVIMADIHSPKF